MMRLGMMVLSVTVLSIAWLTSAVAAVRRVPEDYETIQAAIDAAEDGDTVLAARGVYVEALKISGKSITLTSAFPETRDPADRLNTVLDGGIYGGDELLRNDATITVAADTGAKTRITGFTIRNGDDGIACAAKIEIANNRFINNNDAIDYENGGGICRGNLFIGNQDDAVDVDYSSAVEVVDNVIRDCADDGIEVRLHDYRGPLLNIVIRNNVIAGNGENGIQIINYPGESDRRLTIERNFILQNVMAGIGVMSDGVTLEDFRAATLEEPLKIINNTLVGNRFGIACGEGVTLANNLVVKSRDVGIKIGAGEVIATSNVCWQNGVDVAGAMSEPPQKIDPRLDGHYRPHSESSCRDAGKSNLNGVKLVGGDGIEGSGPDIGQHEQ
jgi:hypothetical protein